MNATQQMAARRYRIERYLTEGGMGAIYIGKKLGPGGFEKEVVLKQLLPEYTERPEFRDLFFREAKISATLDHVNIVHTFDLVESEESLFIVMEYVRGADLRTITRRAKLRRRELSVGAAVHIALETLAGLAYAHTRRNPSGAGSLGIIHRDVSPSNILCSAQGEVKLSDFGIAKASTHASVFYRVRGKVGYMSPEQARNESIDARTDLYSVAVCLYEALTAERLFVGDLSTPPDVIYGQPLAPPSKKRPGLPAALDTVLLKALAMKPDDRYQDASGFADALRQAAHRHGLLFSAPQLAEHLRDILGSDAGRWLREDSLQTAPPDTQKIPLKALEGKEASSLGIVEGSNLYVVSGGDVVSPEAVGSSKSEADPNEETTRKVLNPARAGEKPPALQMGELPISISEDDEEPTRSRPPLPGVTPPKTRSATSPYGNSQNGGIRYGAGAAPPPLSLPPPPDLIAPPTPTSFESPFEDDESEAENYPPTPPPLQVTPPPTHPLPAPSPRRSFGGPPPGMPRATDGHAPAYPAPVQQQYYNQGQNRVPALELQAPETIDFGAVATAPMRRTAARSGPPSLVFLLVALVSLAGGAKLAEIVTRDDLRTLGATVAPQPPPEPSASSDTDTAKTAAQGR